MAQIRLIPTRRSTTIPGEISIKPHRWTVDHLDLIEVDVVGHDADGSTTRATRVMLNPTEARALAGAIVHALRELGQNPNPIEPEV